MLQASSTCAQSRIDVQGTCCSGHASGCKRDPRFVHHNRARSCTRIEAMSVGPCGRAAHLARIARTASALQASAQHRFARPRDAGRLKVLTRPRNFSVFRPLARRTLAPKVVADAGALALDFGETSFLSDVHRRLHRQAAVLRMIDQRAIRRHSARAINGRQVVRGTTLAGRTGEAWLAKSDIASSLVADPVRATMRSLSVRAERAISADVRQGALAVRGRCAVPQRHARVLRWLGRIA